MTASEKLWDIATKVAERPNTAFIGAILIGLTWPLPGRAPDNTVLWATAVLMWLALIRLPPSGSDGGVPIPALALPLALRFFALPLVAPLPFAAFGTDAELATFLLLAVPAGIAVPALTGLVNGAIQTGLKITLLTSAAAVVAVPLLVWLKLGPGDALGPAPADLVETLAILIILPWALALAARRLQPRRARFVSERAPVFSVLLFAATVIVIISKIRDPILDDPMATVEALAILLPVFGLSYGVGVLLSVGVEPRERSAMIIGSGAMNNNMAMAIGFEHFGAGVVHLLVLSEVTWILAFLVAARFIRGDRKN